MDLTSTVENVKCTCMKLIYLSLGIFAIVCLGLEKKISILKATFVCFKCYKNGKRNNKKCVKAIKTKQKYAL